MNVCGTEVRTPGDSPHAYSTEWRHDAAAAIVDGNSPHPLMADDYVFAQTRYLKMCRDEAAERTIDALAAYRGGGKDPLLLSVARANRLLCSSDGSYTRQRIEALLLCPELKYRDIGDEFGMPEATLKAFEKLFFNVRDDEGRLLESKGFLIYCALRGSSSFRPDPERPNQPETDAMYWRVVAFENGYKSLYNVWGFKFDKLPGFTEYDIAAELMRMVIRKIDRILRYSERISMRDLANLVGTLSERFAEMRRSGALSGSGAMDEKNMMLKLVELVAPECLLDSQAFSDERERELVDRMTTFRAKDGRADADVPAALEKISAQLGVLTK